MGFVEGKQAYSLAVMLSYSLTACLTGLLLDIKTLAVKPLTIKPQKKFSKNSKNLFYFRGK